MSHLRTTFGPRRFSRATRDAAIHIRYTRSVARKKRPHVATPDEVDITRDGDFAIIAYRDDSIETTQYRIGAERLTRMTDEDILTLWNAGLASSGDEAVRSRRDMGPLVSELGTLRCRVESYPNGPSQPFIRVGDRTYTPMELAHLLGSHVGWQISITMTAPEASTVPEASAAPEASTVPEATADTPVVDLP